MEPGLTVLVTGSTDGIGRETARRLLALGANVIVHGRDAGKVERARGELSREARGQRVEAAVFDFASLQAVRAGAADLLRRFPRLPVLINNAGVLQRERTLTGDGHEATFQINHLAPYLLTRLLLPALRAARPARVVNVSSRVHLGGAMRWDDLDLASGYSGYDAYAQSKLANVLFTLELAARLNPEEVTANCLHPGVIGTKLLRESFGMSGGAEVSSGAVTSLYVATEPSLAGVTGRYYDAGAEAAPSRAARDPSARKQLWDLSAKLCGLPAELT